MNERDQVRQIITEAMNGVIELLDDDVVKVAQARHEGLAEQIAELRDSIRYATQKFRESF